MEGEDNDDGGGWRGDGEVERRRMWQWTAALTADAALDGGSIVGCHRHQQTAMATKADGDK